MLSLLLTFFLWGVGVAICNTVGRQLISVIGEPPVRFAPCRIDMEAVIGFERIRPAAGTAIRNTDVLCDGVRNVPPNPILAVQPIDEKRREPRQKILQLPVIIGVWRQDPNCRRQVVMIAAR